MKKVIMFYLASCPYCKEAFSLVDELKRENEKYRSIEIELIEESRQSDIAEKYDYYYVPTYFVDGVKVHEGAANKEKIRKVLEAAAE